MMNITVLVSGGGTNLQALIDAQTRGEIIGGKITHVISSQKDAYALERAKKAGILAMTVAKSDYETSQLHQAALLEALKDAKADLIVLAGFLTILDKSIIQTFPNKIMNIHPALIPAFSGKGCYGLHVHEQVLARGVKVTGATVHFVNDIPDGGAIILQKAVEVYDEDTPQTLQKRVMEEVEWQILPQAVSLFCQNRIKVKNEKTYIIEGGTSCKG